MAHLQAAAAWRLGLKSAPRFCGVFGCRRFFRVSLLCFPPLEPVGARNALRNRFFWFRNAFVARGARKSGLLLEAGVWELNGLCATWCKSPNLAVRNFFPFWQNLAVAVAV